MNYLLLVVSSLKVSLESSFIHRLDSSIDVFAAFSAAAFPCSRMPNTHRPAEDFAVFGYSDAVFNSLFHI